MFKLCNESLPTFEKAVYILKEELDSAYPKKSETFEQNKGSIKWKHITMIESIFTKIVQNISQYKSPYLEITNYKKWENSTFDVRLQMKKDKLKIRKINFQKNKCRLNFVFISFLLSKIYILLITGKTSTRRELYYKNLQIFDCQKQVDHAMKDVSYILKAPFWELGILATSKGIVSGPVVLHLKDGEFLNCNKKGGISVPSDISIVESLSSTAKWVLIVEKDASFQSLIDNDATSKLDSCILVTGKGFPDVNTRMLVAKFWEHLRIPILALCDADPYGFEIMCVYRFGSLSMSSLSSDLACPAIRWLGVHPSDIKPLLLNSEPLSVKDIKKINDLKKRSYVANNSQLKSQLELLIKENIKAEIEGVSNISTNYLIEVYIKNKIQCYEYI